MATRPAEGASRAYAALLFFAGALLAAEIVLRVLNPTGTLPWDRGAEEYSTLVPELRAFGAAPVALVGSSRGREGFLPPLLEKELSKRGIDTRVANYSLAGAQAEEIGLAIARLLETRPPPELIVWGVSPRTLVARDKRPSPKARYLWRVTDWWTIRGVFGSSADEYLPQALQNEAARPSWIVRYRPEIQRILFEKTRNRIKALGALLQARDQPKSPMRGAVAPWKRGRGKYRSRRVTKARVRKYVGDRYSTPAWPHTYQATFFEQAVTRVVGSDVKLLLVEIPLHPMLRRAIGKDQVEGFYELVTTVARRFHVPFVTVADREKRYRPRDFMEQSHLNYRGARKFTRSVAPFVAERLSPQN